LSSGRRAQMSVRRTATDREVLDWLSDRLARFKMGFILEKRTVSALTRFEADLATLLRDAGVARALHCSGVALPALSQDGAIRLRGTLVMPSQAVDRLSLPSRFLLKRG